MRYTKNFRPSGRLDTRHATANRANAVLRILLCNAHRQKHRSIEKSLKNFLIILDINAKKRYNVQVEFL